MDPSAGREAVDKDIPAPDGNQIPNPRLSSPSASYRATELSQFRYYPPKRKKLKVLELREPF